MPRGPLQPKFAGRGPRPFGSFLGSGLAPAAINRYFRTNDDLSYYSIPEVTFSGDFEISQLFYFAGARSALFGNSGNFDSRGLVDSDGSINFRPTNTGIGELTSSVGIVAVNTLNTVTFKRSGTFCEILLNGAQVASGTIGVADCVINQLCRSGSGSNLSGIIANVLMYDNGTLVRNYPINEGPGTNDVADLASGQNGTIVNGNDSDKELFNQQSDGDYLGQELWDGILSAIGDGWTDNGDGSYSCDGTQTASTELRIDNKVSQGSEYRVSGLVQSISSGTVSLRAGNGTTGPITSPGPVSDYQTPTTADPHLRIQGDSSLIGVVSDPSFKRLLRVA